MAKEAAPVKETDVRKVLKKLSKTYKSLDSPNFVRSGSLVLDALLGGGIPAGVFIAWASDSGCGKSTGALHISKSYCAQGLRVLYLDFEGGVNTQTLSTMGLMKYLYDPDTNPEGLFMCYQVQTYHDGETLLDALMDFVNLVVIDSATSILTEKVKEESAEKVLPGMDSRVMSTFLKKYKADAIRKGCTWIIINQLRNTISFTGPSGETEAGGKALKFYPDIRIMMKKAYKGTLERMEMTASGEQKVPFGAINEVWTIKSRYSRPFIPLPLAVIFGKGISNSYAYYDYLEHKGRIRKDGSWYSIEVKGHTAKVQGMMSAVKWVEENLPIVKEYVKEEGGYRLIMSEKSPSIELANNPAGEDSFISETESEQIIADKDVEDEDSADGEASEDEGGED